ncbi:MAG: hypothetical protein QOG85_2037 [Gaiellaceae bacterium]|jgi:hypothetical protein|nr:hypothetical protein [Gaiellaceae bacterium]
MIDVEAVIVAELDRMVPLPDGRRADWSDVVRRSGLASSGRHPRRRLLLLAAAAALALAIAVPALGLDHSILDWVSAPAAPAPAQKDFQELDVGAPDGMGPHVSGPARSVMESQLEGRDVHLWVAPTARGGFCLELEGYGGGCDRDRQLPMDPTLAVSNAQTSPVLFGAALPSGIDHVEVQFADGGEASIPVVYVSAPIDASFFVYQLPGSGLHLGAWPATVEAVRDDGTIAASTTIGQGLGSLFGNPG